MARRPPAVARVLERVTATARRHEMFEAGRRVLVACSGGPDSVCLLESLHRLRRLLRIRLAVFHFDHGLHPESASHAAYVRRQAGRLRLPFLLRRADTRPARGESVEAWARYARYAALTQAAGEVEADLAATAHTGDDQAETVLLGLVRGGGLEALSGIDPVGSVPPLGFRVVRPLLDTSREEVEAFCRALGLRPREDPTNRDPRFLRNRIRHRVLPEMERRLDRGIRATLARTAEHVRADAAYLQALASGWAKELVSVDEAEVRIDAAGLSRLVEPLASRVARDALRLASALAGRSEGDVEASHVRAVLDLAAGRPGRAVDLPGRLLAERTRGYVRLTREGGGAR
jgi:tRNA(Ile)-lysidine synthase